MSRSALNEGENAGAGRPVTATGGKNAPGVVHGVVESVASDVAESEAPVDSVGADVEAAMDVSGVGSVVSDVASEAVPLGAVSLGAVSGAVVSVSTVSEVEVSVSTVSEVVVSELAVPDVGSSVCCVEVWSTALVGASLVVETSECSTLERDEVDSASLLDSAVASVPGGSWVDGAVRVESDAEVGVEGDPASLVGAGPSLGSSPASRVSGDNVS